MILRPSTSYDELVANFRWNIPERYNIGTDVCDRWARAEPSRLAIIEARADGTTKDVSFGDLFARLEPPRQWAAPARRHARAIGSRSCCRNRPRSRSRISPSTSSARSRCRSRDFSASTPSPIGSRIPARRAWSPTRRGSRNCAPSPERPRLSLVISLDGDDGEAKGFTKFCERESTSLSAARHEPRRSGADDLHLRHDRPAERSAAWPPRAPRPPSLRRRHA